MTAPSSTDDWRRREIGLALRNALKLGTSLTLTWSIALLVRILVPRFLGPDRFGILTFAEAFAAAAFVVLDLGLNPYVRKEISVRPEHATDFVAGTLIVRALMFGVIGVGMELVLRAMGRESERLVVYIFGIAQFFVVGSNTSAGILHAVGRVGEMSVLSVLTKIVWALGLAGALVFDLGLWAFAASFAVSEGIKALVLFELARRHAGFSLRIRPRATALVLVAALPFFIADIATTIYNRVDMTLLAAMGSDREVGWYGAALGLAGLTMLLTPLIHWVLMPMFSRASAVSDDELHLLVGRSLEFILAGAVPASLVIVVGADYFIQLAFGSAFAPAATAVRIHAFTCLLMYISIVACLALTMLKRTWQMSGVFVVGLVVNPLLNLVLIPHGLGLGDGGGGVACAGSALLTEVVIVSLLLLLLGSRWVDRRVIVVLSKVFLSSAVVLVANALFFAGLGPWRVPAALLLYVGLVLATRAHDLLALKDWALVAWRQKGGS